MQMLVVSDLHYALPQMDWVLEQAGEVELVALVGDLLDISSRVPLETQIVAVQKYVETVSSRTRVALCSGNHDLTARNAHGERSAEWIRACAAPAVSVDGATLDVGDVRVTVCPWWDGPLTRDDVAIQLAAAADGRPDRWIWLYHFPPDASPVSWVGDRHIGDADLNRWVAEFQPSLVLTGHIHESPFRDGGSWISWIGSTCIINPGRQRGPLPAHVFVDLDDGVADWWSFAGQARSALIEP